jgi:uncharacterized protein (TIGR02466 family)
MTVRELFPTRIYQANLAETAGFDAFNVELEQACLMLAEEDRAGQAWCKAHGYGGYTSYASLDDLPRRASIFDDLRKRLDRHVAAFAQASGFELGGRRLKLDSLWVNVLKPGAGHSGHVHPHSAVSGTAYVRTPPGASAIRFEDPRLPLMMAAPSRTEPSFVYITPQAGDVLLWESWLRHEVPRNGARAARISVSFNYALR